MTWLPEDTVQIDEKTITDKTVIFKITPNLVASKTSTTRNWMLVEAARS